MIAGVAFKKTFSYAGFEMQRKKYLKPKIALLNVELELKAEKANAEVRVDSVEVSRVIITIGNSVSFLLNIAAASPFPRLFVTFLLERDE